MGVHCSPPALVTSAPLTWACAPGGSHWEKDARPQRGRRRGRRERGEAASDPSQRLRENDIWRKGQSQRHRVDKMGEKKNEYRGLGSEDAGAGAFTRFLTCPLAWDRPLHSLALSGFIGARQDLPARPESEPTTGESRLRPPVSEACAGTSAWSPCLALSLPITGLGWHLQLLTGPAIPNHASGGHHIGLLLAHRAEGSSRSPQRLLSLLGMG